jgi:hypothetical protein
LAVGLKPYPAPEAVFHQHLVGLGEAQFPGEAGVAYPTSSAHRYHHVSVPSEHAHNCTPQNFALH